MEGKVKPKKELKEQEIVCLVRDLMVNPRVRRIIIVIEYDKHNS